MSAVAAAFVSGATPLEAATLATYAASVVVAKVGTATVNRQELLAAIRQ
jgi:bifunctional ADP-heptose synthase (sugar kinase/adenylyltransferase)